MTWCPLESMGLNMASFASLFFELNISAEYLCNISA